MKKITYLLMLLMSIGVPIHAGVNHPNFTSETIFLECDAINFHGKPRPTIYIYAIKEQRE
tara:strand:- start:192 stop:371 length:180 start_codon:yes stop_codon:yes gene_type:complete